MRTVNSQGLCETTQTERFEPIGCHCPTYPGNLGPCVECEIGGNGRCVYCDHLPDCHELSAFSHDPLTCQHMGFHANVDVNRLEDSGRFMADVRINCTDCGEPFHFGGFDLRGLDLDKPSVSVCATEAHLPIAPGSDIAGADKLIYRIPRKDT